MPTARCKIIFLRISFCLLVIGIFFIFFPNTSFAETTAYRSASTVTTSTIVSSSNYPYTNLSNCSATDGLTCDRPLASGYGNLYFRNFGDFDIPEGSIITNLRIRVTGKTHVPVLALFTGLSRIGSPPYPLFYESCQSLSDRWRMYALNSTTIKVYNVTTPTTNGYLAICLSPSNIKTSNFIFNIHFSHSSAWSSNIDNFEIA